MSETEIHRYFLINKPMDMVSQFVSSHPVRLLGELDFDFPAGTHAIGRLDSTSEGLLFLTTDKSVTTKLFRGERPHRRSYLVLVEHEVSPATLERLRGGVDIPLAEGPYLAVPDAAEIVADPRALYAHAGDPREAYPHTWLRITLSEGKFRQVRKMVMALRHRCLRLIRLDIGGHGLGDLAPGGVKEIGGAEFYRGLC